jgi:hypothetical protein
MKVRVVLVVELDPKAWQEEYGVTDVREDVREYVLNMAQSEIARTGVSVTLGG